MTQQATPARPEPLPAGDAPAVIATRFGPLALDPRRVVDFPRGLFGFGSHRRYQLDEVPGRALAFKLLQSTEDAGLGFLVLPLDPEAGPVARADLAAAAAALAIPWETLAALAIVTLRPDSRGLCCTVNLKAPLLLDTARRVGWQQVLPGEAYAIRHPLAGGALHGA